MELKCWLMLAILSFTGIILMLLLIDDYVAKKNKK